MTYTNIFLVIIIVILFVYIFHNFVKHRNKLLFNFLNHKSDDISIRESFGSLSCNDELLKIMVSTPTQITNCNQTQYNINQYCIKSSYNSAFTGKCMNVDAIPYLLTRGVRLLDFGVYGSTIPMVSNSLDTLDDGSLYLQDIFNTIIQNAFNSSSSPNSNDPLFIHLRIYATDKAIYNNIGSIIYNTLLPRLYIKNVNSQPTTAIIVNQQTILSDLMGKIIIVMDNSIFPSYSNYTHCNNNPDCYDLKNYINIYSGTNQIITQTYGNIINQTTTPPVLHNSIEDTNLCSGYNNGPLNLKMAVPDITDSLLDSTILYSLIQNYGVQMVLFSFYNSYTVEQYENVFENGGSAFTLLSTSIRYINNNYLNTESSIFPINN